MGQTERNWIKDGLDIYTSRLSHYVQFSIKEIPELKNVSALSLEQIKTREGELIMKYGEEIGIATKDIVKGEYVHVHNLDSMRGRGDWDK